MAVDEFEIIAVPDCFRSIVAARVQGAAFSVVHYSGEEMNFEVRPVRTCKNCTYCKHCAKETGPVRAMLHTIRPKTNIQST
jgi:hypothetical protein